MVAERIPGKLHPLLFAILFLMSYSFLFSVFLHFQILLNSLPDGVLIVLVKSFVILFAVILS